MNNINNKLHPYLLYFGCSYILYMFFNSLHRTSSYSYSLVNWITFLFMLFSAFFLFFLPLKQLFLRNRYSFSKEVKVVFVIYLLYLFITLLRDFTLQLGVIRTLFSNEYALLGWLVPLSFFWGYIQKNELAIYQNLYKLNLLGIIIFIGSLIFKPIENVSLGSLNIICLPLLFFTKYIKFSQKIIIYIAFVIVLYSSLMFNQRAIFVEALVLFGISQVINTNLLLKSIKRFFIIAVVILGITGIYLTYSNSFQIVIDIVTETALFPESLSTANTRDFIITEFFNDISVKEVIIGKGFLGTYFSPYFFQLQKGDHFERYTTEIGVLTIILKGGLLLGLIYFYFFTGIVKNLYRKPPDKVIIGLSMYIIVEFFLMFIVNSPRYNLKDIIIWMIIGIIFSKRNQTISLQQQFVKQQ